MQLRAAIITVKRITLAVVLVDAEATYPAAGDAMLRRATSVFPTLPILLLAPRGEEDPLAYATFQFEPLLGYIDPDDIVWADFARVAPDSPAPF